MKIKTTFEFSDGTTITLTREQVEELRAALVGPVLPIKPPLDMGKTISEEIQRKQERDAALELVHGTKHRPHAILEEIRRQNERFARREESMPPRLWDGTEWRGTPIPIFCEQAIPFTTESAQ